jgi:hypothetical protein
VNLNPKIKPKIAAKHVGHIVQQNSPTLLSAAAVVGVAATAYFTWRGTREATRILDLEISAQPVIVGGHPLTPVEQMAKVWKFYMPAAGVGALTVGCIVASNRIQVRRLAALAAAYGVLSGDFDEYRNKALEMLGEKKHKSVDDKIAEEKMHATPPPQGIYIEDGKGWFCDLSTMHYFKTDRASMEKARNDLNYYLLHEGYADLNEAYAFMGLSSTSVGGLLGWKAEEQVEIVFSPTLMPDGLSATGIKWHPEPKPDFDSLH